MPKMNFEKSVLINKPLAEVYKTTRDFNQWTKWSPWIVTEPEAKVTVSDDNLSYSWVGKITGEGGMKVTSEKGNERIDIDLNFLKPWKSYAKVWLTFKAEGEGTRVSWGMDSSLPFFLFFLKNMMVAMLGMDYTRGLNMLKEHIEEGKVHGKLDFKGYSTYDGCNFVGLKRSTSIDKMGSAMEEDYTKLLEHMHGKCSDQMAGNPFTIYHKWDLVKGLVEYTAAVPVNAKVEMLPGMIEGSVPKTKVHTIHHKGRYTHVGNAWSAQYGRQQAKVFKINKKIHPMEEYLNSPKDTAENDLEVNIHFPIK